MKATTKAFLVLVGCLSAHPILAQPPNGPSESSNVADIIKQRVRDWADATIAVDIDKLSKILDDEWIDGYPAKHITKASFLDDVKSGKAKLASYEFEAMDVKVLGDVAVIQGSVTETMIIDGKSSTIHVAFMDVFAKRGDKWKAIRSASKKI